jgi:hypothetical protein
VRFTSADTGVAPDIDPSVQMDAMIDCIHKVTIEKEAFSGHDVMILTGSHDPTLFGEARRLSGGGGPVHIKEGAWLCTRSIIVGPVTVGRFAVVAAGAVVVDDVPDYALVAGVPAKVVKTYSPEVEAVSGPLEATSSTSGRSSRSTWRPTTTPSSRTRSPARRSSSGASGAVSRRGPSSPDCLPVDGSTASTSCPASCPLRCRTTRAGRSSSATTSTPTCGSNCPTRPTSCSSTPSHTYEQTAKELDLALDFEPDRIVMHDYVMEPVRQAADEFCLNNGWVLTDNELPFGLATLEPA